MKRIKIESKDWISERKSKYYTKHELILDNIFELSWNQRSYRTIAIIDERYHKQNQKLNKKPYMSYTIRFSLYNMPNRVILLKSDNDKYFDKYKLSIFKDDGNFSIKNVKEIAEMEIKKYSKNLLRAITK